MTKGEGWGQKSQKIDDVFYERPLKENSLLNVVTPNIENILD